jgi:DNA-directed RNA polymerase specialized sigma24 family protein
MTPDERPIPAPRAPDELVAGFLPLVYNIVGRGLDGHRDVDEIVRETMLRALDERPAAVDPARLRSWLVALAARQVRDRVRESVAEQARATGLPIPRERTGRETDFAALTIVRLRLTGQRREVAEATRWLDLEDRPLLSLWWLEAAGDLTREELAGAMDLSRLHAAVPVLRLKSQLKLARAVVRALSARPRCRGMDATLVGWHGEADPAWRDRIARHTRDCHACVRHRAQLVPTERLLVGMPPVPPPAGLSLPSAGAPSATSARPTWLGQLTHGLLANRPSRWPPGPE